MRRAREHSGELLRAEESESKTSNTDRCEQSRSTVVLRRRVNCKECVGAFGTPKE